MKYPFKLLAAQLEFPSELTVQIVKEAHALVNGSVLQDDGMRECVIDFG